MSELYVNPYSGRSPRLTTVTGEVEGHQTITAPVGWTRSTRSATLWSMGMATIRPTTLCLLITHLTQDLLP